MRARPHTRLALLGLALAAGCGGDPATSESCDAWAEKFGDELAQTEALAGSEAASLRQYVVSGEVQTCREEMTQPEVDCLLAGEGDCYAKHRPWYRKLVHLVT